MADELVELNLKKEQGTIGISLNLGSNNVGVVLMGGGLMIQEVTSPINRIYLHLCVHLFIWL